MHFGSFTGFKLLAGRGPGVKITISSIGDVVTSTNYSSFIVSQIIDSFKPNESVGDRIYRKYYSENRDETGKIIFKRYVDH